MLNEYQSLAFMSLFFILAWLPSSIAKFQAYGAGYLVSSRTKKPDRQLPVWGIRSENAHNNLKDNLLGFVSAILILGLLGKFNSTTQLCAMIYVCARVSHFFIYIAGLNRPRTLAYAVGLCSNIYLLCLCF